MSTVQLVNGKFLLTSDGVLRTDNRGFCYGDGFFESMRVSKGNVPFLRGHWKRLLRVTAFLRMELPSSFTEQMFGAYAMELAMRNGFENARIRFQGYRMGAGRYSPENNMLGWSMICQPLESSEYQLNKTGLNVGFCTSHTINPAPQSSFKTSNSLPYVMGGIFASENGFDDCFLLDVRGNVAEATGSNVFLLKGNKLMTPDLSNGGVAGVMRTVVLREATDLGLTTSQIKMRKEDVLEADECFLTNATRGIQWVGAVEKKRYFKRCSSRFTDHINRKFDLLS